MVAEAIQKIIQENKGFELTTEKGDKISFSKWGQKRKSYLISICKKGTNVFQSVGTIREDYIELLSEAFNK